MPSTYSRPNQKFSAYRAKPPRWISPAIHTDIGNRAVSAIINGVDSPISQELHNGDRVQIITDAAARTLRRFGSNGSKPAKRAWSCATTSKPSDLRNPRYWASNCCVNRSNTSTCPTPTKSKTAGNDSWPTSVANRRRTPVRNRPRHSLCQHHRTTLAVPQPNARRQRIAKAILEASEEALVKSDTERLVIHGDETNTVTLSKCCRPIRGDLASSATCRKNKDSSFLLRLPDCPRPAQHRQPALDHDLEWDTETDLNINFPVALSIIAVNEKGLLAKVASRIADAGANIADVSLETQSGDADIRVIIDVTDRSHLAQVFKAVRTLRQVKKISRRFSKPSKN